MNRSFWAGYLTAICLHSLFQDALGKAEYIALIDDHLVDATYSVPIAIIGIIIAIALATFLPNDKQ